MDRIVVGLDGTPRDDDIVDWVANFAAGVGARVIAAHFVPRVSVWMIAGAQIDSAHYFDELREHFEHDVLAPLRARVGDVHLYVEPGDPAHELAAVADRCAADLIAIGAPDHNAVHDIVFGNFERRLVHLADVPVLTIPARTRPMHLVR